MKTIIVLGMHRSATSLVAQGLFSSGVFMGDRLMGSSPGNPQGHFEDMRFVNLNDSILAEAGGSWDNPPPEFEILQAGEKMCGRIAFLVKASQRAPLWGWKDPRTTLTVKCYLPFLSNPIFVPCFRDPADIAASLHKRDGTPIERGVALANEYNKRLLSFLNDWTGTHDCQINSYY